MNILITGSNGLIGSSIAQFFLKKDATVVGIDNNMRQKFFGEEASTINQKKILNKKHNYQHHNFNICNQAKLEDIFKQQKFDLIVHTAAQPSHDKAKEIPLLDFEINALATLNLLELTRKYQRQAVFVFTSTNKVYGDRPNQIPLIETSTRYTYANNIKGIDEKMSIDQCTHSLFGVSKAAADLYVQEYGKYFNLKTTVLRLGCITGATHASSQLHGFLSFLVKSLVQKQSYQIIGYKGKQVRDQLHADDVASAIAAIYKKPGLGEVFNLGGGPNNNASILELIALIEKKIQIKTKISYQDHERVGDHICYITNLNKFQHAYPKWKISKSLEEIVDEIVAYEQKK